MSLRNSISSLRNSWKALPLAVNLSIAFLALLILFALSAEFLANDRPILCKYQDGWHLPVYSSQMDGKKIEPEVWAVLDYDFAIWPLIHYRPNNQDLTEGQWASPFSSGTNGGCHILGADGLGRDLLSGLIYASRVSLSVGLISMGLAFLIALILGGAAGFWGDDKAQVSIASMILILPAIFAGYYYAFYLRWYKLIGTAISHESPAYEVGLSILLFLIIIFIFFLLKNFLKATFPSLATKRKLWLDIGLSRLIEIVICLPTLLLIISLAAIGKPSLYLVMGVIGLTGWTGIARLIRAELLRIRSLEYLEGARGLGLTEYQLLIRHALPNALGPALVAVAFGMAGAILTESALSFLGIGVPAEVVTWGSMLSVARENPQAWWMAIFPGLFIFATVYAFNVLGEYLRDRLDPTGR